MEENAESKELQIRKLEATVKSLSEELIKVCINRSLYYIFYVYIIYTVCIGRYSTYSQLPAYSVVKINIV